MKTLLLLFSAFVFTSALTKPKYLKACNTNDPEFKECALNNGREALISIIKGDKKFHIPSLEPLKIPFLDLKSGNLNVTLRDLTIFGISKVELTDLEIDKKHAKMYLHLERVELIGQYQINGKILILPLTGEGRANLTAIGGDYILSCDFEQFEKDNEIYAHYTNDLVKMKLKRVYFNLENLFNGNKPLGDEVNKFLNDNWEDIFAELGVAVEKVISSIAKSIFKNYFENIPQNELFIE